MSTDILSVPAHELRSQAKIPFSDHSFENSPAFLKRIQEVLTDQKNRDRTISAWDQYNNARKYYMKAMGHDSAYLLSENEITVLRQQILESLMWDPMVDTIAPSRFIGYGMTKYETWKWGTPQGPRQTNTFEGGDVVLVSKEKTTVGLHGFDYDVHIDLPTLDAGRSSSGIVSFSESLDSAEIRILSKWAAYYRNWQLFRGSDQPGCSNDIGITGLLNDANVSGPTTVGTGNALTNVGDGIKLGTDMAGYLIQNKLKPPFVLDVSVGAYLQLIKNKNTTTYKTDLTELYQLMDITNTSRLFNAVRINPFLIDSETETNSTAAACAYKPGVDNFEILESYPLSYYPLPNRSMGLDGKILWMGAPIVHQAKSIAYKGGLTVNTL